MPSVKKNSMWQPARWQEEDFLPHPVPDSNIITWLNLKGKLSFDLLRKKILLWGSGTRLTPSRRRYMGLSWRQRDFLSLPIRQLQHSIYSHLQRTAPLQVIPEKSPPTLGSKGCVKILRHPLLVMLLGEKHSWIHFSLPLQSVHQSDVMAHALLH